MLVGRARFAVFLLSISLACAVPPLLARKKDKDKPPSSTSDPKRALHALNRLTFGPRPGDVQQVMATGVDQWIDLQLHPEKIDDSALNARLEPLRTTRMSTREIAEDFPDPQEIRQVMNGKKPMPSDPARRAVFQVQLARQEEKKERKEEAAKNAVADAAHDKVNGTPVDAAMMAANSARDAMSSTTGSNDTVDMKSVQQDQDTMAAAASTTPTKPTPEEEEQARRREERLYSDLEVQQLPNLPPDERFKKV